MNSFQWDWELCTQYLVLCTHHTIWLFPENQSRNKPLADTMALQRKPGIKHKRKCLVFFTYWLSISIKIPVVPTGSVYQDLYISLQTKATARVYPLNLQVLQHAFLPNMALLLCSLLSPQSITWPHCLRGPDGPDLVRAAELGPSACLCWEVTKGHRWKKETSGNLTKRGAEKHRGGSLKPNLHISFDYEWGKSCPMKWGMLRL